MSRIVRTTQLPGGLFIATAHLDRVATSAELAVRMAGAASLGCDLDQVLVTGQARDIYLVSQIIPRPAATALDKCHGSEVRP